MGVEGDSQNRSYTIPITRKASIVQKEGTKQTKTQDKCNFLHPSNMAGCWGRTLSLHHWSQSPQVFIELCLSSSVVKQ